MKCHNCKVDVALHNTEGCDNFQVDSPHYGKAWSELTGYLHEAIRDGGGITPEAVLDVMRDAIRADRNRTALTLKIEATPAFLGEAIEAHFKMYPEHGYNCGCMDKFIRIWKNAIQKAKPSTELARRAMRYVLVTGERDY